MKPIKFGLACSVCGARNYTVKRTPSAQERLAVKKFCKHCGKVTLHQQTR